MRLLRGLGALSALLIGLIGIPTALVVLGGNPLPAQVSWAGIQRALFAPDDGTVLIGLITIVGWIGWLLFAISVVAEVLERASGCRIRIRLPGTQRLAAGLLVSVIAIFADSQPGRADPVEAAPFAMPAEPTPPDSRVPTARPAVVESESGHVHVVRAGDDLWSLAEHYYGNGREWRKIAMANPGVLTGGPDRLQPGWQLRVPDIDSPDATDARTVLVRPGDTLSSIADEEYGKESDWQRIFRANRAQLADPDELVPGTRLVLPGHKPAVKHATEEGVHRADRHDVDRRDASPEPTTEPPQTEPPSPSQQTAEPADQHASVALGLASVGSFLAAGVIAGLAFRRRVQLQLRPVGGRIIPAPEPARRAEVVLGQRQQPLSLRALDLATRAISAHCHHTRMPLPALRLARVGDERIELAFAAPAAVPPRGFAVSGNSWLLDRNDRHQLLAIPGVNEALRPYPSLVSIGRDDQQRQLLLDLEGIGLLALDGEPEIASSLLAAITIELAFSPSVDELVLTLVGDSCDLAQALGRHNVAQTNDLDGLLDRLEQRAKIQRTHKLAEPTAQHRIDPDLSDAWVPEIVLINVVPTAEQSRRLIDLLTASSRVTMAAVVAGPLDGSPWSIRVKPAVGDDKARATLEPIGLDLAPQLVEPPGRRAVVELVTATGTEKTTHAPWWWPDDKPPHPPPEDVTYLGKTFGRWNNAGNGGEPMAERWVAEEDARDGHPVLQLLGPIGLLGAAGTVPARAGKQCLEYCAWLLENPGTTAVTMASALAVAEGTRRSNMSRLRTWLGSDDSGEPYLPDAYTGRIVLHPAVSSDWQRFQILTSPGINRSSTPALRTALELVRGAPLADAAPGQWHWAEEMRTDMISAIRDLGVELTSRALEDNNIDLARWAASRALAAAPGDELLMAARIRTEHQAGNVAETGRLTLKVAAQARSLGLDLDPATVILLQEVMEGQVRARLA